MQAVGGMFAGLTGAAAGGDDIASVVNAAAARPMSIGPTAGAGMTSSSVLNAVRFGTSALSAVSGFAMSQEQAGAMRIEAGDEELAARSDYVQAQQKSNQINLAFNRVIGAQLGDAASGGIDVGSGSVQEAGRQAEQQRNRVTQAAWAGAQTDAALRQMRATYLNQNADMTATTGLLSEAAKFAQGGIGYLQGADI